MSFNKLLRSLLEVHNVLFALDSVYIFLVQPIVVVVFVAVAVAVVLIHFDH